jgi:hypothetical protein
MTETIRLPVTEAWMPKSVACQAAIVVTPRSPAVTATGSDHAPAAVATVSYHHSGPEVGAHGLSGNQLHSAPTVTTAEFAW